MKSHCLFYTVFSSRFFIVFRKPIVYSCFFFLSNEISFIFLPKSRSTLRFFQDVPGDIVSSTFLCENALSKKALQEQLIMDSSAKTLANTTGVSTISIMKILIDISISIMKMANFFIYHYANVLLFFCFRQKYSTNSNLRLYHTH